MNIIICIYLYKPVKLQLRIIYNSYKIDILGYISLTNIILSKLTAFYYWIQWQNPCHLQVTTVKFVQHVCSPTSLLWLGNID